MVARAVTEGRLRLSPGADVHATLDTLTRIAGVATRTAATVVMRALHWPDAFSSTDTTLQHAAGVTNARSLLHLAERWRPWRGYAAAQLALARSAPPFASAG